MVEGEKRGRAQGELFDGNVPGVCQNHPLPVSNNLPNKSSASTIAVVLAREPWGRMRRLLAGGKEYFLPIIPFRESALTSPLPLARPANFRFGTFNTGLDPPVPRLLRFISQSAVWWGCEGACSIRLRSHTSVDPLHSRPGRKVGPLRRLMQQACISALILPDMSRSRASILPFAPWPRFRVQKPCRVCEVLGLHARKREVRTFLPRHQCPHR